VVDGSRPGVLKGLDGIVVWYGYGVRAQGGPEGFQGLSRVCQFACAGWAARVQQPVLVVCSCRPLSGEGGGTDA
jgi:hypothetical protein